MCLRLGLVLRFVVDFVDALYDGLHRLVHICWVGAGTAGCVVVMIGGVLHDSAVRA